MKLVGAKISKIKSCLQKGTLVFFPISYLPANIRNIDSTKINVFKRALDNFLVTIPDEPTVEDQGRAAQTNSLLHQIPLQSHNHY